MEKTLGKKSGRIPEYIIYMFLWLILLIIPVITNSYDFRQDFRKIEYDWLRMSPFLIVFIINSMLLLPFVLFRGRTKLYLASLLLTTGMISGIFQVIGPQLYKNDPELLERRILQDPQWGREDMSPASPQTDMPGTEIFRSPAGEDRVQKTSMFSLLNTFLISLLIAGFNTAIAVTNKWVSEEQARKEIEREHIRSELAFLQHQISPHFFMNTLNNIHSLIDIDSEKAQHAILKLSEMMRYFLYESGRGKTTLRKEVNFLLSYIQLMKLRVDEKVKIEIDLPEHVENVDMPPLLFIAFIENAFKHGVSYMEPSFLSFRLKHHDRMVEFITTNTVPVLSALNGRNSSGGVGLENIRKRLDLLYGNNYNLEIEETTSEFTVRLVIPVQN